MDQYIKLFEQAIPTLIAGTAVTITLTGAALAISLIAGMLVAVVRIAAVRPVRLLAAAYVELMRIFPVLTLLFLLYFGLAGVGMRLTDWTAAVVGLGIWGTAYMSEIYRGGIEGVDHGQMEAGLALGMPRWHVMQHIILPQSVRLVVPTVVNFAIGLLKYSSVASTVGVLELTFNGRMLGQITYRGLEAMLMVGVIYLALSLPLSLLAHRLQRHLRRHVYVAASA